MHSATCDKGSPAIKSIINAVITSVTANPKSGCFKRINAVMPVMHKKGRYIFTKENDACIFLDKK